MNTTQILQTLGKLGTEDRAWVIARLPARAKAQLLKMSPNEPAPRVAEAAAPQQPSERMPADIDVGRLAAVLMEEPSWIAATLLEGSVEPWVTAVLDRLPATMRADIAENQRAASALTPHAKQALLRTALKRVGRGERAPAPSRFQSLLARVSASRTRKRLTIHL